MVGTPHQPTKIIIELIRGPFDGATLIAIDKGEFETLTNGSGAEWEDAAQRLTDMSAEEIEVLLIYRLTQNGMVGQIFEMHVPDSNVYPFHRKLFCEGQEFEMTHDRVRSARHEYCITETIDDGDEVLVQAVAQDTGKSDVTVSSSIRPKYPGCDADSFTWISWTAPGI